MKADNDGCGNNFPNGVTNGAGTVFQILFNKLK